GVELAVADTGIGMTEEHVAVALTPFAQVENAYTRKYEGTGLGLPLSKGLVELHGGVLDIKSQVHRGTTVTIRLPAARRRIRAAIDAVAVR
ncbi:MAG TPA: ATP-binding protein, partial [Stellaceae bacterium]|nr:ATP-binding protein [Stellaceae bacterium]